MSKIELCNVFFYRKVVIDVLSLLTVTLSGKLSLIFFVEKNLMLSLRGLISWKLPRLRLKKRSPPMNITRSARNLVHKLSGFFHNIRKFSVKLCLNFIYLEVIIL